MNMKAFMIYNYNVRVTGDSGHWRGTKRLKHGDSLDVIRVNKKTVTVRHIGMYNSWIARIPLDHVKLVKY